MAKTLETFTGKRSMNYCTNPLVDVEILVDEPRRDYKTGEVLEARPYRTAYGQGFRYYRADGEESYTVGPMCAYCGTTDPTLVRYTQEAWYDKIGCSRCGGVTGHAIGD